ncbi:unnamed protein product [Rotaria socialis]|uniref:Uncharacterized protein n=7 Tax=Rotaria TaxID=231623 RepID=A0A820TPL2_9BILA|nr:unnamed protein product [Rotaria socialis]
MDLSFLYDNSGISLPKPYEKKNSWLEWFRLRRRKPNSEEEINEIHDLILNVYESMDDQARAVVLSLSKIVHDEDESVTIEEKLKAIVAIGHSLCCGPMQIKNATHLYARLFVRALSHQDLRMCLAAMIAISETAIDNLSFQMKVNEMDMIPKLFEIMQNSMPHAGRNADNINIHSKLVAWSCYTIVNICANCMPNILLLRDIVPNQLEILNDAIQMEIWRYVWRENYAQTIVQFVDGKLISGIICNAIQPKPYLFENHHDHSEKTSNSNLSSNPRSSSVNSQRYETKPYLKLQMSSESTVPKPIYSPNRIRLKTTDQNTTNEHELSSSGASEESHTLLSETVTTLASNVYNELERIIKNFGENSVKDLMPVMISTLESLDSALNEREVSKLEIESLKEQNEQVFQQYEREKGFHKEYQQRYLQVEDHLEEMKRENDEKLQSLESIVKIFEIKSRNAADHVARLEEKENETKTDYKRLHDRYCELFKAHCDYMERTKILYGTDRVDQLTGSQNASRSRGNLPLASQQQSQLSDNAELSSNERLNDETTNIRPDISFQNSKQPTVGANFRSELEASDGTHTQTETNTTSSNDAAVNTAFHGDWAENWPNSYFDDSYIENYKRDIAVSDDDDDMSANDAKNAEAFYKETQNENIDISDIDSSADLFGMTKEVSNLIKENNELLETKNALNVLKDDLLAKIEELSNEQEMLREEVSSLQTVKNRYQSRITEVEEELRKTREELEKKKKEEEEDVPTADRKRFTRVEMQRVLLERNQYKQRLFELEEAMHWQDAMRASKHEQLHPSAGLNAMNESAFDHSQNKKRTTFWKLNDWLPTNILSSHAGGIQNDLREGTTQVSEFFSGLFGTGVREVPPKRTATTNLSTLSTVKRSSTNDQLSPVAHKQESTTEENRPMERSVSESTSIASIPKQTPAARQSSSILINDDSRLQAYGWSLSSKSQLKLSEINGKVQVNVPVPVYCRPIFNTNDTTQIWWAVGIDLDGSSPIIDENSTSNDPSVDQLNKQLIESYHQMIDEQCLKLSSIVWIAAKSNDTAMITIIDSNKAEKVIDTFTLGNTVVYTMGSVPGPTSNDYTSFENSSWTLFEADTASASDVKITPCTVASLSVGGIRSSTSDAFPVELKAPEQVLADLARQLEDKKYKENRMRSGSRTFLSWPGFPRRNDTPIVDKTACSTKYPTVWLGSGDGWLYIHSAISEHRKTLEKVWLRHAIFSIVHVRGRVFVALANEKIVVFHRNLDGTWNLNNIHLIVTGKSRESVRCMIGVGETLWCGVANRVYVLHTQTLEVRKQFDVHSRPDHSVQHMTWSGDGVWLSIRLSSTLQLYHAQTYQHLQDVDVQPYVEKMIATEKAGLYFVHISALTIACRRLWIGTGNGIIISVPLTDSSTTTTTTTPGSSTTKPGSVVRVYDQSPSSNYIPYCSMNNAQLSFHGYRDAVKFFVAVPGQPPSKLVQDEESLSSSVTTNANDASALAFGDILVVSGGDGYIDFRVGDSTAEKIDDVNTNNRNISYLIVWHLGST